MWDPIGAITRSFEVHLWSFFLLVTLCLIAGLRIHGLVSDLSRALARSEMRTAEMQAVNELSRTLSGRLGTDEIGFEFCNAARRALDPTASVSLVLVEDEDRELRRLAEAGPRVSELAPAEMPIGRANPVIRRELIEGRRSLAVNAEAQPELWSELTSGRQGFGSAQSFVAQPLVVGDRLVGLMYAFNDLPGFFDDRVRIVRILGQTVAGTLLAAGEIEVAESHAQRGRVTNAVSRLTLSSLDANTILKRRRQGHR